VGMMSVCVGWDLGTGLPLYLIDSELNADFETIFFCGHDLQILAVNSLNRVSVYSGDDKQDDRIVHTRSCWMANTLSPDQCTLAAALDYTNKPDDEIMILLIDVVNGREITTLFGHERKITALTYNSEGNRLACGCADQSLKIWDALAGTMIFTYNLFHFARSLSFNPLGNRVIGRYLEGVFIFNIDDREMVDSWEPCDFFAVSKSRVILM
jgi:WD40 repeat protein